MIGLLIQAAAEAGEPFSEGAQFLAAVGVLAGVTGAAIAGVVRSYALMLRARADLVRARMGTPTADIVEEAEGVEDEASS